MESWMKDKEKGNLRTLLLNSKSISRNPFQSLQSHHREETDSKMQGVAIYFNIPP